MSHGHAHQGSWSTHGGPPPHWPPPFSGPPPMPQGMSMNPQHWAAGQWQFNPSFNSQRLNPGVQGPPPGVPQWAPGFGWGGAQPGAGAQQHNSHKRVPKEPDPSYWATKLSDNPLGLSNMVPRSERRSESTNADDVPQTPWIWNPPGLVSHKDEDQPIAANLQQLQVSRRSSQDALGRSTKDVYPASSSRRESSDIQRENSQRSHGADAPPLGRPSDPSSLYHRLGHQDGYAHDRQARDRQYSSQSHLDHRNGTNDHHHDTHPHHRSTSEIRRSSHSGNGTDLAESFTSRLSLQPTFSPNIVRTPDYYQSPPSSRRGSQEEISSRRSPNRVSPSQPDFYTPPSSASYSSGRGNPNPTAPVSRHSSMPVPSSASASSSAFSGLSNFVDEPSEASSAALSPLVGATPRPSSGSRPVLRSQTEPLISPNGLSTIAEAERHASRDHARGSPLGPSPLSRGNRPSPQHSSSFQHNPLPPPPRDIHNPMTSAPLPRSPTPPLGTWTRRVRKGFWNRRGDFLTRDGYIVYAPPERVYPSELRTYPEIKSGFRNETGDMLPFIADRPELPESLPSRGQPPLQPYDLFVQYEYLR